MTGSSAGGSARPSTSSGFSAPFSDHPPLPLDLRDDRGRLFGLYPRDVSREGLDAFRAQIGEARPNIELHTEEGDGHVMLLGTRIPASRAFMAEIVFGEE